MPKPTAKGPSFFTNELTDSPAVTSADDADLGSFCRAVYGALQANTAIVSSLVVQAQCHFVLS